MSRPSYMRLHSNYPRLTTTREQLFASLGWSSLVDEIQYHNTCAIRMSVACLKGGVRFSKGGLIVQDGPFKGQRIEPSQAKLSQMLVEMWGEPEKFDSNDSYDKMIGNRQGVASFFRIDGHSNQGHIDLVEPWDKWHACVMSTTCYFSSSSIWFWDMK
jgi:hypothetical protein